MNKPEWGWLNISETKMLASEIASYFLVNHYECSKDELYELDEEGNEVFREEYVDEFSTVYDDMEDLIKQTVKVLNK